MMRSVIENRTSMPACPDRGVLAGLALGKLPLEDLAVASGHVEDCLACQESLQALDDLEDSFVRGLKHGPPPPSAGESPELERRLRTAEALSQVAWGLAGVADDDLLPRPLGQYQLLECLGRGGMGVVYKARHAKLKRLVAVKLLSAARLADRATVERFHREMEAVAALDHPHIVRAHDAGEAEGTVYFVMELVEGVDLARLVRRTGPLSVADACAVVGQAARGLQHAHEHGFVHRDVKPSNLMLTAGGHVKVLDLGLARLGQDTAADAALTDSGQVMGTADFMAPEQGLDARRAGPPADVYSLGCTLFFLLAGRAPFDGPAYDTAGKKLLAHVQAPVPSIRQSRPDVPVGLAAALDRMLAKEPGARFATMSEVAATLDEHVGRSNLRALWERAAAGVPAASSTDVQRLSSLHDPAPHAQPRPAEEGPPPRTRLRRWLVVGAGTLLGLAAVGPLLHNLGSWNGAAPIEQAAPDLVSFPSERQEKADLLPAPAGAPDRTTGKHPVEDEQRGRAVVAFLDRARLPAGLRHALRTALGRHPQQTRWVVSDGQTLLAVAARPLPAGDVRARAIPALVSATQMQAVEELLAAKALLDAYAAAGLTDATALRQAILAAAGQLHITGKVQGVEHQAGVQGDFAVAYVFGEAARLAAYLHQPSSLAAVQNAYREVLHRQARDLMDRARWEEALLLWKHLHARKLVSDTLYLDAARCFQELKRSQDAQTVLEDAYRTFASTASADWLEQCGDLALGLGPVGEILARHAYEKASERLRNTLTPGKRQP